MAKSALIEAEFVSQQVTRARRFYFGRDADGAGGGLEVVAGGWELVAHDYMINRPSFPWPSIEFVAGGRGWLHIGGEVHELARGVCYAYGPGVPHRIETDPADCLSKYYVNFDGREGVDRLAAADLRPGTCRRLDNADELERACEGVVEEGAASRPQAPAIAALLLRVMLLKITDQSDGDGLAGRRTRETVRKCVDYMDRHFLVVGTVEEAAAACHVSVGHLTRAFARFGYGSPYRYLTRRKMVHAAALLDSGRLLAREVADRLGMDAFQFSRVFKRVHGISPSEFVRRHGERTVQGSGRKVRA